MSSFRQSQALLHSWSGLVVGWVLFAIFLTGTVSFWREDISRWMRPEIGAPIASEAATLGAVNYLQRTAPDAKNWSIYPNDSGAQVYWQPAEDSTEQRRRDNQALVGADGLLLHSRDTKGGEFFYRFHFDLYYVPVMWARWFVGFCSMMMFVAIISGIITHKKIFADFFTFRRRKGLRSWLDGHNAVAVLALPFHLMITYTGLVTFMTLYMPWAGLANYDTQRAYLDALSPSASRLESSENPSQMVDLAPILAQSQREWPDREIGLVRIEHPGDANSRIIITPSSSGRISVKHGSLTYSGTTGKLVHKQNDPTGAVSVYGAMIGLHSGRYAPDLLRWIYFLSGLAGTVMVGSGLVMWIVKRRAKLRGENPGIGFQIVERLNVGFVAGLPFAMTVFLWANRLLPVSLNNRAEWEVHSMFAAWAVALLGSVIRPGRETWKWLFGMTGTLLIILPIFDLNGARSAVASLRSGDTRMFIFSLALVVLGSLFLLAARGVHLHPKPAVSASRQAQKKAANSDVKL